MNIIEKICCFWLVVNQSCISFTCSSFLCWEFRSILRVLCIGVAIVLLKIVLFSFQCFCLISSLLLQRYHFLALLNEAIFCWNFSIFFHSFLVNTVLIFCLDCLTLRLPLFSLGSCHFLLFELLFILLNQLLKIYLLPFLWILSDLLSLVHIFKHHSKPFLDFCGEARELWLWMHITDGLLLGVGVSVLDVGE